MATRPPVLLTRPEPESLRFAVCLGVPTLISPLLRIERRRGPVPAADALLLTSGHGVAAWVEAGGARSIPAWCVGPRTAAAARAAGLDVRATAADAVALADIVPDDAPPLLHARGAHTRGGLAGRLRARGLRVAEAVVYDAVAVPLTEEARRAARAGPVVAPVFSPRTACLLAEAWPEGALGHLHAVALSPAVARALPVPPFRVATRPDGAAMAEATLAALGS